MGVVPGWFTYSGTPLCSHPLISFRIGRLPAAILLCFLRSVTNLSQFSAFKIVTGSVGSFLYVNPLAANSAGVQISEERLSGNGPKWVLGTHCVSAGGGDVG